jgi:predicted nucleic acid-binding protein
VNYLLDTNVVSEWVKPRPNPGVVGWLSDVDEDRVFLSVITIVEVRFGIERMLPGERRRRLAAWLEQELPLRFESRILNVDPAVAETCGKLAAAEARGRRMEAMDALIAATAITHSLSLVTRDASHFQLALSAIINPWS